MEMEPQIINKSLVASLNKVIKKEWEFLSNVLPHNETMEDENQGDSNNECSQTSVNNPFFPQIDVNEGAKYFIDGTMKYLVVGYVRHTKNGIFPILLGDVAASCGELLNNGSFQIIAEEHILVLAIPKGLIPDERSDTLSLGPFGEKKIVVETFNDDIQGQSRFGRAKGVIMDFMEMSLEKKL